MNDLVVKAAALALRAVPEVNVTWDARAQAPAQSGVVDIAIAVSVPGGLMTPIVKGADKKARPLLLLGSAHGTCACLPAPCVSRASFLSSTSSAHAVSIFSQTLQEISADIKQLAGKAREVRVRHGGVDLSEWTAAPLTLIAARCEPVPRGAECRVRVARRGNAGEAQA